MIDLRAKPFYLTDGDIAWVENTLAGMTTDEKLGQLFIDMLWQDEDAEIERRNGKYGTGGYRYGNMTPEKLHHQNMVIQRSSRIPALIAANIESGGNGGMSGGTHVGDPVAIGATGNRENAYAMGYYGTKEAAAIGCNWTFAPIVDINYNWRNCVVSNRCFGSDPDMVLQYSLEYMRGAHENGVACCMKHFPGDGCDERDQHIVTTVNDKSYDQWMDSFGRVYKGMIDAGVESVMVGHIQAPEVTRRLRPGIADQDILPATMAPELLQDMLRGILGFNGLIITDATHMVGLTGKVRRSDFVPGVIMAGCDMILYYRDKDEDMGFLHAALENGRLTYERLDEAVTRILGFKAMLKLHEKARAGKLLPDVSGVACVGSKEHMEAARKVADEAITLVKSTKPEDLPLTPRKHRRIMLYSVDSLGAATIRGIHAGSLADMVRQELESRGFQVTVPAYAEGFNGKQLLASTPVTKFANDFDAVMLVLNIAGFSQSNERRIHWSMPMGPDIPWYVTELPTYCVSFNNPFHLIDVPMVPTYVNAYSSDPWVVKAAIDKLMGLSPFKGKSTVDAFCGAWDTHL